LHRREARPRARFTAGARSATGVATREQAAILVSCVRGGRARAGWTKREAFEGVRRVWETRG
jgi:hypothetical protein